MASAVMRNAYGIDLADGRITVVRAVKKKKAITYEVLADSIDVSTLDENAPVIRELNRACEKGDAVASVASSSQDSFIRLVEAPFPSLKKAAAVFPSMLDVQLPFPLEKCVHRFVRHQSAGGKASAAAVAVPEERLLERLEQCKAIGLDPECVEQEAMALWRFSEKTKGLPSSRPRVILFLDHARAVIIVGNRGLPQSTFSTRSVWSADLPRADQETFVNRLKQQVAGTLGVSIETAPDYFVCGPRAAGSLDQLRDQLGVSHDAWCIADDAPVYLAKALANGVLEPDEWTANLRFGEREHTNLGRLNSRAQGKIFAVSATASVLLMAVSLASSALVVRHHDGLQKILQEKASALTGITSVPRGQEVFIADQYVDQAEEQFGVFNEWMEPTVYSAFKQTLEAAYQLTMTLETIAVQPGSLTVQGTSADWNDPDKLAEPLRNRGWTIHVERKNAGGDERVHFTMRAQP